MKTKFLKIFFIGAIFSSLILSNTLVAQAKTCADATPQYTDFEDEQETCLDEYEECIADPYDYEIGDCGGICNEEFPNRIRHYSTSGCLKDNYEQIIMDYYENEHSTTSAKYLVSYCDCVSQCVKENKTPKDLEVNCEKPLERCCKEIHGGYNNDYYDNKSNNDESDENSYFTISNVSEDGDVEVIRSGSTSEIGEEVGVGAKLFKGDHLVTGYDTTVVIKRDDLATILIDPLTNIIINKSVLEGELYEVEIKLRRGSMTSQVKPEKGLKAKFEIRMPTSTAGVRGTIFTVKYDEDTGETTAIAHQNDIYVASDYTGEEVDVSEGDYFRILSDFTEESGEMKDSMKLSSNQIELLGAEDIIPYKAEDDEGIKWGFIILSVFLFLISIALLVLFIIFLIKKKKKISIIFLASSIVLFIGMIFSTVYSLSDTSKEKDEDKKEIEDNNDNDDRNEDDYVEDNKETDNSIENQDPTDNDDELEDNEKKDSLTNLDNIYSFDAGDITQKLTEREVAPGEYVYCYPKEGVVSTEWSTCMDDEIELFRISVIDQVVYDENVEFGVNFILLDEKEGQYIVLETPNGDFPEEVLPITKYTEMVEDSFESVDF